MNLMINGETVELRENISLQMWVKEQNISHNTVIIE